MGPCALLSPFGAGCGPGPYLQTAVGLPHIGQQITYRGSGGFASSLAIWGLGFSNTLWNGLPLPASLAPFGAPGCNAYCDLVGTVGTLADVNGQANVGLNLPNAPGMVGVVYYTQYYSFGATLRSSNGLRSLITF